MNAPNPQKTIHYLNALRNDTESIYLKIGAIMAYVNEGKEFFIARHFNQTDNKQNQISTKGLQMNELMNINGVEVKLEVANDQIYTTSLQVAEVFEKRHGDIIAKIMELPQDDFRRLNSSSIKDKR